MKAFGLIGPPKLLDDFYLPIWEASPERRQIRFCLPLPVDFGISGTELAHEIGRYLGVIKPAPPSVGYITIKMNSDRSKLVPNAETFESNLQRGLKAALADVLRDRTTPAEPELSAYHSGGFEVMIEKTIQSGRVPIILADDLASSAQRPDIFEVLKLWEARIRTAVGNGRKPKEIIRGVLIYFHADDYKEVAQFSLEEIRETGIHW